MIRVLLADDQSLVRAGFRALLDAQPDIEVAGEASDGEEAVRKVLADRFGRISGMRWDHIDAFVTGNRAVTVWTVTGRSADGEVLNYRGCDLYEFRGDKILSKDTYWKLVEHRERL